jgi:chemotaxis protein MotB
VNKKRRRLAEQHLTDESWLIPYADLLTLLLALFVILFASSQVDTKKYEHIMRSLNSALTGGVGFFETSSAPPIMEPDAASGLGNRKDAEIAAEQIRREAELRQLKEQLDSYIQNHQLSAQLQTGLVSGKLTITIRDSALFASGSANLTAEARQLALAISGMLHQYPDYEVEVSGHTDNVPIHTSEFETNWELSAKRAINFMKVLIANDPIGPERFRAIGYGEYRPIASNGTAEGRAQNRRVEVQISLSANNGSEQSDVRS